MKRILYISMMSLLGTGIYGQQIVSLDYLNRISKEEIQFLLFFAGVNTTAEYGINLYKMTYTTQGSDMQPDTASGLVMLPQDPDIALPLMIYQHGTTSGRSDVPSRLRGGYELGALFAALGMAVVAPDFLGMGDSRGFHPYVHAATQASASIDMLQALESYLEQEKLATNGQLFITGYSQGGHAAMSAHQVIERDYADRYTVTASLPMSGPYSLSNVMRKLVFTDDEYFFPAYLVYTTRGYQEIYGDLYEDISEVFRAEFMPMINTFVSTGEGLFSLNEFIVETSRDLFGRAVPKRIFNQTVFDQIESDPLHPFNLSLKDSDLDNWIPKAPVLMLYCRSDEQVPFRNSVRADSIMNALGAENVTSVDVSGGLNFTHGGCIQPALNRGVPWILSFMEKTTSTDDIEQARILMSPNPTSDYFIIDGLSEKTNYLRIYDFNGRIVLQSQGIRSYDRVDVSHLPAGKYVISIIDGKEQKMAKLAIIR